VTVMPGDEPGQVVINIKGRLNALLGTEAFPNRKGWGGGGIAGSGGRNRTGDLRIMIPAISVDLTHLSPCMSHLCRKDRPLGFGKLGAVIV
jgi:hypothetical protein